MKQLNTSQIIEKLTKLLSKSDNYRDSVLTYHSLAQFSFKLGNINNSTDIIDNIMNKSNKMGSNSYKKLKNGGLFMGSFIPLEKFREHLRTQMPHFLFAIIFPIHFIFHRIFPKLPVTKQIYFIITKGNNRIFSKAEIFGRLSFCGFEMIQDKMIGDRIYFICKK